MKWKQYFTPAEAAGTAMKLKQPVNREPMPPGDDVSPFSINGPWDVFHKTKEAYEIYNSLLDEILFAKKKGNSYLVIAHDFGDYIPELKDTDPTCTTLTRESLGVWFYSMGDIEKAILFNPDAEKDFNQRKSNQPNDNELAENLDSNKNTSGHKKNEPHTSLRNEKLQQAAEALVKDRIKHKEHANSKRTISQRLSKKPEWEGMKPETIERILKKTW